MERLDWQQERTNDRCSAIKQVASGRFGVTSQLSGKLHRKSRSKWHREQSLVKADICLAEKGISMGCQDQAFHTRRRSDLPAATSRYLFYRGSGATDL